MPLGTVPVVTRDGKECPVAFYGRKLSPAEKNYSATELEGLAVVASIQHIQHLRTTSMADSLWYK